MTKEELLKKLEELKEKIEKEDAYREYRPVQAYYASFSAVVYYHYFYFRKLNSYKDIQNLIKDYIEFYLTNFVSVLLAENSFEAFKNFIETNFDKIEAKELDVIEYWLLTQMAITSEKRFELFLKLLKLLEEKINK